MTKNKGKFFLIIYNIFLILAAPIVLLILLYRVFAENNRSWFEFRERLGFYKTKKKMGSVIWCHVASVGELVAVSPLLEKLSIKELLITSFSTTGRELAMKRFPDAEVVLLPLDEYSSVRRFFSKFKPKLGLIMETEIWPNLIFYAARQKIPLFLINARLSAQAIGKYRFLKPLYAPLLENFSKILAQSEPDYRRFSYFLADTQKLILVGNLKFDLVVSESTKVLARELRKRFSERIVWIAASTHEGEEKIILESFMELRREFKDLLLFLVPRHVNRFNEVFNLSQRYFTSERFTTWKDDKLPEKVEVLIGDVLGQMLSFYGASDLAFVGGSLVPIGGHNLLEPLAFGLPVLTGTYLEHCEEIRDQLLEKEGLRVVSNKDHLTSEMKLLLTDESVRKSLAKNGELVLNQHRGAIDRTLKQITI